jgi:nucleotide-binding universal stress UspA family protein
MTPFERILVDIDPAAGDHPALDMSLDLAARCGAQVKIVDVVAEVPSRVRRYLPPELEAELTARLSDRLQEITEGARRRNLDVSSKLLRGRAGIALIQEVLLNGHDLVVRSHERDLKAERRPFGSIDMKLLRYCPCPVWLVGAAASRRPQRVLAAVHASEEDPGERRLNEKIVELARTVADLETGTLTILHAWSAFGEDLLAPRLSPDELSRYVTDARQAAATDLTAFARSLGDLARGARVELVKGAPEDVIPEYASARGVDLVVMGTVARTGIAGLVIGNTAERVLQRLRCSVLAVKPDGFVSPVTIPAD